MPIVPYGPMGLASQAPARQGSVIRRVAMAALKLPRESSSRPKVRRCAALLNWAGQAGIALRSTARLCCQHARPAPPCQQLVFELCTRSAVGCECPSHNSLFIHPSPSPVRCCCSALSPAACALSAPPRLTSPRRHAPPRAGPL